MDSFDHFAVVALGSNLGDSKKTILAAMGELQKLSAKPIFKSSLWQSAPLDCPPGSPLFINAVVLLETLLGETPESLLEKLQALERGYGRQPKTILNEARPLDLDLILFGREQRETERLWLPHPRSTTRRFVLQPLAEIAPHLTFPNDQQTVSDRLKLLAPDRSFVRI